MGMFDYELQAFESQDFQHDHIKESNYSRRGQPFDLDSDLVIFAFVEVMVERNKAWKICFEKKNGTRLIVWLPKSQCKIDPKVHTIQIPRWFACKNSLHIWEFPDI